METYVNKLREPEKDGMISRLSNERELLSMQIKLQQIEFDKRAQESCWEQLAFEMREKEGIWTSLVLVISHLNHDYVKRKQTNLNFGLKLLFRSIPAESCFLSVLETFPISIS